MDKVTLLGIGKLTSKTGKDFVVFHTTKPFGVRDINKGCFGNSVEQIFIPDDLVKQVDFSMVGKELNLEYEVNNGRAYLSGFSLANPEAAGKTK